MEITYAEYFAGIGAPGKALKRVTAKHGDTCKMIYGFEIDKYARTSYCGIHGEDESKLYYDITNQPDILPYVDIIYYSPPCQSFSLAGNSITVQVEEQLIENLIYQRKQDVQISMF